MNHRPRHAPVLVFQRGSTPGLAVDEVLGNREVVVKNLGPQLARSCRAWRASVLASGAVVVLIYNPWPWRRCMANRACLVWRYLA